MKKTAFVTTLLALSLIVLPVAAVKMKAYVDFDRSVDFGAIETFAYFETLDTSLIEDLPPVHEMVKLIIIRDFQRAGMKQVGEDENPDVFVTYHSDTNEAMRMNVTLYSYSYSAGWFWSPLWGSGMDVSSYSRGTIIIDVWDPTTETLLWRGTVLGVVPENPSPKKAQNTIEKALKKIGAEWRKQRDKAIKEGAMAPQSN
jgi:hypothetical protein